MSNRITDADLKRLLNRLNSIAGFDNEVQYNTVGAYLIDGAYGGVKLVQVVNAGGGIREISTNGYGTKRELYNWMNAYITGMTKAREKFTVYLITEHKHPDAVSNVWSNFTPEIITNERNAKDRLEYLNKQAGKYAAYYYEMQSIEVDQFDSHI